MNPGQMNIVRKVLLQTRAEAGDQHPVHVQTTKPFLYWLHSRLWDMIYLEEPNAREELSLPWKSWPEPPD